MEVRLFNCEIIDKKMNWDLMNTWELVLPPSRPSLEQLNRIRAIVNCVSRNNPVAVLGSTPEFRTVLCELGFRNIYIFEKNRNFYDKMTKLIAFSITTEHFVEGDWLNTLENYQNYFSVILSDLTMGNVPYENRRKFYADINNALTKEGVYVDKILTHNIFLDVKQLIEEYSIMPINLLTANQFNCQMLFCSELLKINNLVDSTAFYNYLEDCIDKEWMHKLIELTELITPRDGIWYYGKVQSEIENDYLSALSLKMKWSEPICSPYYLFCYHYLFGKK